jgi:3-oxoacid CoA-transferase subunit A
MFAGLGPVGMSKLLLNEQVDSVINSYPGPNLDILDRLFTGKIRLEVLPQGTLVEKIRAGGAGIAGEFKH